MYCSARTFHQMFRLRDAKTTINCSTPRSKHIKSLNEDRNTLCFVCGFYVVRWTVQCIAIPVVLTQSKEIGIATTHPQLLFCFFFDIKLSLNCYRYWLITFVFLFFIRQELREEKRNRFHQIHNKKACIQVKRFSFFRFFFIKFYYEKRVWKKRKKMIEIDFYLCHARQENWTWSF